MSGLFCWFGIATSKQKNDPLTDLTFSDKGASLTGNQIPSGWNTNNTSLNISGTLYSEDGLSFNPISAGTLIRVN